VQASGDDVSALERGRVDVVTTRSVLIYVDDKLGALEEFRRVLKTGGRISLFIEPINSFCYPEPRDRFAGYDVRAVRPIADKLRDHYEGRGRDAGIGAMVDFDERDLLRWVEEAGFEEISMEYGVEIKQRPTLEGISWGAFLRHSGNPLDPTFEEAAAGALTEDERERLYEHLRPLVERSEGQSRLAKVYLWATGQ